MPQRYEERFDRLQAAYERGAESSDDIALLKLLELAPVLSDGTFSLVRRLCSDPKRCVSYLIAVNFLFVLPILRLLTTTFSLG